MSPYTHTTRLRVMIRRAKVLHTLGGIAAGAALSFHSAWGLTYARAESIAKRAAEQAVEPVRAESEAHKREVAMLRPVMDRFVDRTDHNLMAVCRATPGADCR